MTQIYECLKKNIFSRQFSFKYTRLQPKKRVELEGSELNNSSKGMAAVKW
jgi:hypothetical protein